MHSLNTLIVSSLGFKLEFIPSAIAEEPVVDSLDVDEAKTSTPAAEEAKEENKKDEA